MRLIHRFFSSSFALALVFALAASPVTMATARPSASAVFSGNSYSQDFNTLEMTGATVAWGNDSTLAGWYLLSDATPNVTNYITGFGNGTTGGFYSFGSTAATDRALGSLPSNGFTGVSGTGKDYIGLALQNTTGASIGGLALSYIGEQWRANNVLAQTLTVDYRVSASAPAGPADFNSASGGWTAIPELTFTSPVVGTNVVLVGNDAANRVALSANLTGLSIPVGGYLLLRWADVNDPNSDHGLAVDDLTVTASAGSNSLSINDVSVTEGNSGTTTAAFTVSLAAPAPVGGVSFDIATADGTATVAGLDYQANSLTGQNIAEGESSYTFNVLVNGDTDLEPDETFQVNITNVIGVSLADGAGMGTIVNDEIVPIYTLQGSGPTTSMSGTVTTEGVVVGDYEGASPALRGFYIQDPLGDGNPLTSDGIFVYNLSANSVSLGDLVRVTGTIGENQGQTEISAVTAISVLGSGNSLAPTDISLPFADASEPERYEGMLVRLPQTLYVTEMYQLGRFGQVTLASERLAQPTNVTTPGAAAIAMQAANDLKSLILDDELNNQNPDPIRFGRGGLPLSAANTLRGGDSLAGLTGVMTYTWAGNVASGNAYRLRPVNALGVAGMPNFSPANPRPAPPARVSNTTLRVAGMNLLNYFNTFGLGACKGGVNGASMDCRGADNQAEFDRQAPKTVAAILGTDADVIGIAEMENDGYGANSAIQDLVTRLNTSAGAGTYAFVDADALTGGVDVLGTDAIKVGFIYKPARASLLGVAALNSTAFVNGGDGFPRNRPALAATFQQSDGARVTLVINHLKSKGSACDAPDALDGQGNCNQVRVNAATALANWLATDPTGSGDPDFLILGDLNSYAKEDPITTLQNAGYTNLIYALHGPLAYSYVFDGQWGYLDHALASASLTPQALAVLDWHINADEPSVLDYNTEFKSPGQISSLYAADELRMGDHDPVLVDLHLTVSTVSISGNAGMPGAKISYTGGNTTADPVTGAYSITVNSGWTGSISPSKTGYVFTPPSYTFSTGVTSNQTRDFSAAAHATFQDVPTTFWSWIYIETLAANGVTNGCSVSPMLYCPGGLVMRAQMAVFLLRAKHGSTYTPPAASGVFTDVPVGYWAAAWIEQLASEGITSGCSVSPKKYCPEAAVTRDQMAVFLLRAEHGSSYTPPAATGVFADAPGTFWAAAWIEQLELEGVTTGCSVSPKLYCPANPVARDQMAVFLVRTFKLP